MLNTSDNSTIKYNEYIQLIKKNGREKFNKKMIVDLPERRNKRNSLPEEIRDTFHGKWDRSFVDPRYVIKCKNVEMCYLLIFRS